MVGEAASAGLQLLRYEAYDVFAGSPEYQLMVLTPRRAPGGPAVLRGSLGTRLTHPARKALRRGTRFAHAVRLLRAGDRVPADARLTLAVNLAVDEAALTGESAAVKKTVARFDDAGLSLGDRKNMTYAGTLVANGRGEAVVVSTGMSTEFGHVARLVESVEAGRTPLQENLDRLGATLGNAALVVVALVVAVAVAVSMGSLVVVEDVVVPDGDAAVPATAPGFEHAAVPATNPRTSAAVPPLRTP